MYDSVQLVQNSVALNGTQRVLLDDVISVDECSDLKQLAQVSEPAPDGIACCACVCVCACTCMYDE